MQKTTEKNKRMVLIMILELQMKSAQSKSTSDVMRIYESER